MKEEPAVLKPKAEEPLYSAAVKTKAEKPLFFNFAARAMQQSLAEKLADRQLVALLPDCLVPGRPLTGKAKQAREEGMGMNMLGSMILCRKFNATQIADQFLDEDQLKFCRRVGEEKWADCRDPDELSWARSERAVGG